MSEASQPPPLPQFVKKRAIVPEKILTTCMIACPKCKRPTYITATDDRREPYNRIGCFVSSCNYIIP